MWKEGAPKWGRSFFHAHRPLVFRAPIGMRSALWLSLVGGFPVRELFCTPSALDNGIPKLLGERIFCQLFGCKDFRGMILPLSMIRVRQSWDTEARVFARRRNTFSRQAVAPLGGVLNDTAGGGSVCGSKNDKQRAPRNKIREGASLEEQVRSA